jgi:cytochrome c-type biogenesis protein CcmH
MTMLYIIFTILLILALGVLLWPVRQHKRLVLGISLLFFAGAFGIYSLVGSPEIIPLLQERQARLAVLKEIILRDSEAVKVDPKNLKAWIELGQSFAETGQYGAAANAFKQSVLLSGGDPALIMAYAKAMILDADGKVSDHAKKSLEMVLIQQPDNFEARYFVAVRKLQEGKTEEAMKEMKALYHSLPEDSPLKAMIDRQIGRQ